MIARLIFYAIGFVILFVLFVRHLERTSVFYPEKGLNATPEDVGLPYEDVTITTQDGIRIHGWLVRAEGAKSTLLFFHGNAGNIAGRLGKIAMFRQLGTNVLIIDYRGYGLSEGRPTEKGIYLDALAAYDHIAASDEFKGQKIISYGASLGGAVAVDLATKRPVACIIADSTFASAADIAKMIYPYVPLFLIRTKLDSLHKIGQLTVPKLFIHSVDDMTVPFAMGKKLYDAAPEPKEFITISGSHTNGHLEDLDKFQNGIRKFLIKQDCL